MDKKTYYKYKPLKMVEKLCGFPTKGNIFPLFGHKTYFYEWTFLIEIIFTKIIFKYIFT